MILFSKFNIYLWKLQLKLKVLFILKRFTFSELNNISKNMKNKGYLFYCRLWIFNLKISFQIMQKLKKSTFTSLFL
ncbi:unnamed protein product [Blepharisma stoltei]|uniref:Ribosomal protein L20 n=1 Tax=Blepharisma stoltei TaxID=1481888 RepID=A0AAU9J894_9CILI|nr:unnamed protein product [Blepharisma stoltei]